MWMTLGALVPLLQLPFPLLTVGALVAPGIVGAPVPLQLLLDLLLFIVGAAVGSPVTPNTNVGELNL